MVIYEKVIEEQAFICRNFLQLLYNFSFQKIKNFN